jgi:hypothetical protein
MSIRSLFEPNNTKHKISWDYWSDATESQETLKACARTNSTKNSMALMQSSTAMVWNYGLNYDFELTPGADIRHVALVKALVDDMKSYI